MPALPNSEPAGPAIAARSAALEIATLDEFDTHARHALAGDRSMRGWRLQGLDLRLRETTLAALDPQGAVFLGGDVTTATLQHLRDGGAVLLPELDVPFRPYRGSLYTATELYAPPHPYEQSPDAVAYRWALDRVTDPDVAFDVIAAVHDTSMDDALAEYVHDRPVVGIMGGHALERGSAPYRDAAVLGRDLTRAGFLIATGGGPGAMEAANLGAYLAPHPDSALPSALEILSTAVSFTDQTRWSRAGFAVLEKWPTGDGSVGVPTWFYGHEPPNVFATAIAKYFRNAVREDSLIRLGRRGVVFLPGAAGTVQEVFQDACENHYATADTAAPMIFLGTDYWTRTLPVWPLLATLAAGRPMARHLHLLDDLTEVREKLAQ